MALEASDLNDGTILQQTKQAKDARGNIQFSITLPMGKELRSEFVQPDKAREALKLWLDVVKEQAIAEAKEHRLQQQRKATPVDIERKPGDDQPLFRAGGARDKSIDDVPMIPAVAEESVGYPPQRQRAAPARPDETIHATDPLKYAQQQYEYYSGLLYDLRPRVAQYEKFVQQWGVILESLEEQPYNPEEEGEL